MSDSNKSKIGIHMNPELISRVDAEYALHDYPSQSAFVCEAVTFFLGYLHSENDTEFMSKTTLAFIKNQVAKLDAKICELLFAKHITRKNSREIRRELAQLERDLETMRRRDTELTALFKRLYEDNVLGKIPKGLYHKGTGTPRKTQANASFTALMDEYTLTKGATISRYQQLNRRSAQFGGLCA